MKPAKLLRQRLLLECATLGRNVVGVCITIFAALRARSIALAGFSLDSVIEIGASSVVIWQLTGAGKDQPQRALRLIGRAFFALAIYILVQSSRTLYLQLRPAPSLLGIAWLVLTCVAMLALAFGKHRVGRQLNNPVLLTEGRVTLVDAYLAGSVLMALVLNAALGWWWADPLAGFVLMFYGCKEGVQAWTEGASSVQAS